MQFKKILGRSVAWMITIALLLLLTSPLWIGWMMEYEHNKTNHAVANVSLPCDEGAIEKREVWSKLGIAIFCEQDGVKHGIWQAWDGGYMHISGEYVEGKKHGTWKYFNAHGEQWAKRSYADGKETSELIQLLIADSILVKKKKRRLYLIKNGQVYRKFNVRLGANPVGHKQKRGDECTPEGHYVLDSRNAHSEFYKSMRISYPNKQDRKQAQKTGMNSGDAIMIHGLPNGFGWAGWLLGLWDWTDGSIAVTNHDMDEIWSLVKDGTPIEITP